MHDFNTLPLDDYYLHVNTLDDVVLKIQKFFPSHYKFFDKKFESDESLRRTFIMHTYNGRFIFEVSHHQEETKLGQFQVRIYTFDENTKTLIGRAPIHSFKFFRMTEVLFDEMLQSQHLDEKMNLLVNEVVQIFREKFNLIYSQKGYLVGLVGKKDEYPFMSFEKYMERKMSTFDEKGKDLWELTVTEHWGNIELKLENHQIELIVNLQMKLEGYSSSVVSQFFSRILTSSLI